MIKPLSLSFRRLPLPVADRCRRYFLQGLLLASLVCTATFTLGQDALHFQGDNDYVDLGTGIPTVTTFTIEAWIKPSAGYGSFGSSSEPVEIISRWGLGGAGNAAYRLGINSGGKLVGAVYDGANGSTVTSTATIPTNNVWLHVAFTRSADNTMRLYINGVLDGTTTNSVVPQASNYSVFLGKPPVGSNIYSGSIDEVRIWNRGLLACEITNQRNCELPSGQTGLLAYYKFNQSTGTSLTDASGNNNTGTLYNFALTSENSNWVATGGVTSGVSCAAPVAIAANSSLTIANGNSIMLTASGANSYVWSTSATSATVNVSPTVTTTYSVTGTTANGCSLASTTVTVRDIVNCNTYFNRTTANGLGNNSVNDVKAVGNTVYAATDGGLSISTDGGRTFQNRTTANGLGSNVIYRLAVVAGPGSTTIYAATPGGLGISTDGGQTFINRVLTYSNAVGAQQVIAVKVVGSRVYALLKGKGKRGSATEDRIPLIISTDGGTTFSDPTFITTGPSGRLAVAGDRVYILLATSLAISSNAGQNFSLYLLQNDSRLAVKGTDVFAEGDRVFVVGAGVLGTAVSFTPDRTWLFASTDGGSNFTKVNFTDLPTMVYAVNQSVYMGTSSGLRLSSDGGQSFPTIHNIINGLVGSGQVRAILPLADAFFVATSRGLSVAGFGIQTQLFNPNARFVSNVLTIAPTQSANLTGGGINTSYLWSTNATTSSIVVSTSGTYSVTAQGSCPGTYSVAVSTLEPINGGEIATLSTANSNCPIRLRVNVVGKRFEATGPGGYLYTEAIQDPVVVTTYNQFGRAIRTSSTSQADIGYFDFTNIRQPGTYTIKVFDGAGQTTGIRTFQIGGVGCP